VAALLHDAAFVQDDDAVHVADGGEAVGDDDRRAPAHQLAQRVLDQRLRLRIHAAGRFIEDQQDLRIEGDGPREGEQLLLADGKARAALVDLMLILPRQLFDEVRRVDVFRRLAHALVGDRLVVQADVAGDRAGEDEGILQHRADVAAQIPLAEIAHIDVVY